MILSGASYFESLITEGIIEYSKKLSPTDYRLVNFVEKKALKRQYHTLFDWNSKNTNTFWGLFGDDAKSFVRDYMKEHPDVENAEKAFIDLGNRRNLLVHENFAEYDVNITRKEIYEKYKLAYKFVEFVINVLDPDYKRILSKEEKKEKGETLVKKVLEEHGEMTVKEIEQFVDKSDSSIRRYISTLLNEGIIEGKTVTGKRVVALKKD